ncbi:hypothetical protein JAAARDRAFT_131673 [Jaapia argillacea MUCL 33604]|uniref:ABC transporter domain-containing protein n=1 Tax=Jaapia argillacea MUCL 33604 TaxID=933084 RepID=A0A067PS02_9AGAM|nr:hypothetical protein JAAARDRAFT_131673 [Jaapia argillacea MUCL 33604]
MADPSTLEAIREDENLPTLSTGIEAATASYADTALHNAFHHHHSPPHSPAIPQSHSNLYRTASHASHVEIDHFDPEGVDQLRRTLTHMSATPGDGEVGGDELGERALRRTSSIFSEATLGSEGPLDFEKILKTIFQRSVPPPSLHFLTRPLHSPRRRDDDAIKSRSLGIIFENLTVTGLGSRASYQPTLGSSLNPLHTISSIRSPKPIRSILSNFEGVIKPGEMVLVLGAPGSGCSTLLKTLANQTGEYHSVSPGSISYDSFSPQTIAAHYRGDVQYCPEDDVHFPTLTVQQTLDFAAATRSPHSREGLVEVLMTVFGLRGVRGTKVGDEKVRGVSGGEKKRVSIAECLAGGGLVGAWDNSTRGLDASTALEFVRALRIATDLAQLSTIVSIYQAGESLYELFDKVCVIYEGKMAYFGPADKAREYFVEMGYEPAYRQTTADFLVAVTDPNGRTTHPGTNPPRTAAEFASHFLQSPLGALNRSSIESYRSSVLGDEKDLKAQAYVESARAERKGGRKGSVYVISLRRQVWLVMKRRVQILRGAIGAQGIQTLTFIIQGIIIGTVFYQVPESTAAYFSRGGVLFFALLFSALTTMAEIPALFAQRPIVLRQQKAAMYHPFIESLAMTLVDVPITFLTLMVFVVVLYFLVGLQRSVGQFFIFYIFVFAMSLTMKSFFRVLAAAFKDPAPAQAVAGIVLLGLTLYTGYNIPKPYMIGALRWITYINPLRYGYEAILTNEFHTLNGQCATLVPQGPGYEGVSLVNQVCSAVGSIPGQRTVNGDRFVGLSYGYYYSNLWMNFGVVCAFGIGLLVILLLLTEFRTSASVKTAVMLFKRGGVSSPTIKEERADEEKGRDTASSSVTGRGGGGVEPQAEKALAAQPKMTDVFSWQHIQYVVPVAGGQQRRLLDDVAGYVAPGKLTALMGESGAGKTTLLNVLAQRTNVGVVTGDRFVNGQRLPADFQAQTGYCQQMDTHLETTTVREALLFSAKLRQPASVPLDEKEAYVERCLEMCGLQDFADAIVGSLGVEHRKRTTIGVELAAKPKLLLFLDEPTSGLDSQSAWAIMTFLRQLADAGTAILCTIHQPSSELFHVFDRLLLLRKGGQTVYFGDIGRNSSTLINYFEGNGSRHCEASENPAEFMLDVIGAGATANSHVDWHTKWTESKEFERLQEELDEIHTEGRSRPPVEATLHSEYSTTWGYQMVELLKRDFQAHYRNPTYLMAKLMLNIAAGLFIGFTFFRSKSTLQGTQNKLFAIFMATIVSVPLANQLQVPFLHMRSIYEVRERPSRMYSWTALVTSQIIAALPWNILGSTLFFICWYWTVEFPHDRAGYTYLMLGIVFPLYYTTIGQAVAAMAANAEIAAILFSFLFSFVLTFNGVLQPFRQLGWWRWMYRVSPYTYLIEGLLGQALGKTEITCNEVEYVMLTPPSGQTCGNYLQNYMSMAGGYLTNPNASSDCQFCSARTADQFLGLNFNIEYSHHWRNLGLMFVYIAFNIAATFLLTYLFRMRTWSLSGFVRSRKARQSS